MVLNASESKGNHCAHYFRAMGFFNISFNRYYEGRTVEPFFR